MSPEPESLLAHAGWVRALARRLVADPNVAEDLVQETWVTALQRPPVAAGNVRGWLGMVLINLARQFRRSEERRRHRERDASRREALPAADEIVERVSTQKVVVEAVLGLPEQYRTAVLMRWFDGLPPRVIAQRLGVPVAMVHTRLARGHERLRASLDRTHGGDRKRWVHAVALLVQPFSGELLAATLGVLLVDAKVKVGVVGLLVAAGLFATWSWTGSGPTDAGPSDVAVTSPTAASDSQAGGRAAREDAGPLRREVAQPEPRAASSPAAATRVVQGTVFDERALPAAGVRVRLDRADGPVAESGAAGRFALEVPLVRGELVSASPGRVTLLAGVLSATASAAEPVVVVAPAISLAGRVVDEGGTPLAGARVRGFLPATFRSQFRDVLDFSEERHWSAETDAAGWFDLREVGRVAGATLHVQRDGFRPWRGEVPAASDRALHVVLEKPKGSEGYLLGEVIDPAGVMVADARVSLGRASTLTDERGAFRIMVGKGSPAERLIAMKKGHLPALAEAPAGGWPEFVVLELGAPPLALAGTVVDETGKPLSGIKVWVSEPTLFGNIEGVPTAVESFLGGAETRAELDKRLADLPEPRDAAAFLAANPSVTWGWRMSDAAGRFTLAGLLPREYRLVAMDPATLLRTEAGPVMAGAHGFRIVLPTKSVLARVAGRVVSRSGEPVPGVSVTPMTDAIRLTVVTIVEGRSSPAHGVVTDAAGAFVLENLPRELVYLQLDGDSILPVECGRGPGGIQALVTGPNRLELVVSLRLHARVELEAGTAGDSIAVLDREEKQLQIHVIQGHSRSSGPQLGIAGGRTDTFSVSEDAATLVLRAARSEVRRVPLALRPGEVNVLRL